MKKKLLISMALLSTTAFAFADGNNTPNNIVTVYSNDNNITYTYDKSVNGVVKITADGQVNTNPQENQVNISVGNNLSITYVHYTKISNRTRDIKLTISNVSDTEKLPQYLGTFTRQIEEEGAENLNLNASVKNFVNRNSSNKSYTLLTSMNEAQRAEYNTYCNACQKAIEAKKTDVKIGQYFIDKKITTDTEGYTINKDLYYVDEWDEAILIKNTTGSWKTGTIYSDSYDTYIPTTIVTNVAVPTVAGDTKVGNVTLGIVDQTRFNEIVANNAYLNYDFTGATTLAGIASAINDNKIAYFPNGSTATGKNIVIGTTCDNYAISDNGQEIYVSKEFSASTATYTRTFSSDGWGTIVLPFNIGATTGVFSKQAFFSDYTTDNAGKILLTFTNEASLVANKPYLVKVAENPAAQLTELNTTVRTTSPQTFNVNGIKFIGTYTGVASTVMTDNNYHILNGKGQLLKTSAALKPGRCYIDFGQSSSAKLANTTIQIIDEDGSIEEIETGSEATSIDDIENGEVVATQYISVNGQISNEPFNGMNIVKKTFANGTVETSKVVY